MKRVITLIPLLVAFVFHVASASGQTTQLTHHGNLGFGANGNGYDIELRLFDTPTVGTGTQQGADYLQLGVQMTDGEFTVQPAFGTGLFTGAELYLETGWRVSGGGAFTVLSSREKISAVYANRSLSAATADSAANATLLGGLSPNSFIQNTTSQQPGVSFNIGGDGTAGGTVSANAVNAATQFNLGGNRVLSISGLLNSDSLSVGVGAGTSNTGPSNSFFGSNAGKSNANGGFNSFFGSAAGQSNTSGVSNSFFGASAGRNNTAGDQNSFFGLSAGYDNNGFYNSFFGAAAGRFNTTGSSNAFFGTTAGFSSTTANYNVFLGHQAGYYNTTGSNNLFSGMNAGLSNTTGSANTILGFRADLSAGNISNATAIGANAFVGQSNATAIGANAFVGQSNSLVLGSINGVNGATADTNVGIGTITPAAKLHISGPGGIRARINSDFNSGLALTLNNEPKWSLATVSPGQFQIFNDATGQNAVWIDPATNNVGIGTSPSFKLHVNDPSNTGLRVQTSVAGGTVASFGGSGDFRIDAPGVGGGRFTVKESGNTGIGTNSPAAKLDVSGTGIVRARINATSSAGVGLALNGQAKWSLATTGAGDFQIFNEANAQSAIYIGADNNMGLNGRVIVGGDLLLFGNGGGTYTSLCINGARLVAACGSSLRYKTNVAPFSGSLELLRRLRPITFNWKADGEADFGLAAEEVAAVEPLLVTHNSSGQIEGVKYDRLGVVLINALKEQQTQLEQYRSQLSQQQAEIAALRRLICAGQPDAEPCKPLPPTNRESTPGLESGRER